MVNLVLPYRVALGEHNDDHSLVIHSGKGIDWYNVPPGLEKWLKTIQTTDILDVALGPNSQWYLSYNEGSSVRRRISAEVWDVIFPQMRRRLNDMSKVSFGCDNELLAIAGEGQNADMLVRTRQSIYQVLKPVTGPHPAAQDISVVAFGRAKNNFVLKIANTVILGGHGGVRGSSSKKSQMMNQRIVAATLSPLDNNYYVITFDDGSSRYNLPKALGSIVTPHMAPEMSLTKLTGRGSISGGPRSPAAVAGSAPITPKVQKPSRPPPPKPPLPMPPLSSGSSTQLRILNWNDPDFIRISKLFLTGWRHTQKLRPVIQHMYEVKLPPILVESYCAYRHEVLSNCIGENICLMERELFHGTSRRCMLGNHPEIKNPCYDSSCRLCCVLRASFAVKKAGTADGRAFLRFGEGIYTSSVSSKADDYTSNYWASQYKVMLVARVVLGRGFKLHLTTTDLKGPPEGYHSVLGEVGLSLNYDEQVVFKDEAIRPANRHSLVAHSAKGIEWENVHPGLENVLKRIHTRDILDLALGCEGQYFLKYREGSAVRQVVTPEVLSSIYGEVLAPSKQILKIAFGNPGELWAIFKENGSATQILQVRSQVSEALDLQKRERTTVKDIAFVALGRSQDNFAIKIRGELSLGGNIKVFGNHKYKRIYDRMVAVTLSPLDDSIYLITYDDGSSRSNLPNTLEEIIKPHLDPEMSLLLPERGAIPSALFRIAKTIGFRVSRGNDTTELELLKPYETDYRRIEKMFRNGWKHPQKSKPDLRYIYGLKLPGQLITSHLTYRLNLQQTTALSQVFERELFHGTPRRCLLGNEPELTKPCDNDSCRLCRIIKTSFTVKKAGTAEGRTFLRFGRGIYTSSVSSKADDYTVTPRQSGYRAMLVARVILGKAYPLKVTTSNLTGPPKGYNSVIGEVGLHLNYDEQVVYKDEAALPVYLVVYKP